MHNRNPIRSRVVAVLFVFLFAGTLMQMAIPSGTLIASPNSANDPWSASQVVQPADLVRELLDKAKTPPTVVYVGDRILFSGGHIPGAVFPGTASTARGLTNLEGWADPLPRSTDIVIYCGCCPFDHCPNIKPAFISLRVHNFTHLRVLALPTNFATDWVEKGFPIQTNR